MFNKIDISAVILNEHTQKTSRMQNIHTYLHTLLHRQTRWKKWESMIARISAQNMVQIDL